MNTVSFADEISKTHSVPVMIADCLEMTEKDIIAILESILYEFPVTEISVEMPQWMSAIPENHSMFSTVRSCIKEMGSSVRTLNDVRDFTEGLEAMLMSEDGFNVVALAANGQEALEQISVHRPDVVLSDVRMPKKDGFQVLTEMRNMKNNKSPR